MATLIVINGPIAAGKTTLGKNIAAKLCLPFISKDTYKEILFDELSIKDRAWSQKLGAASWKIIYATVHSILAGNQSCIFEANFNSKFDSAKIQTMIATYKCQIIEVNCFADGNVLFERFKKRSESGERHPGHRDHENYAEF